MNDLLRFYYGSHPDHRGRMLAEVLQQDDFWFEHTHDFIQWLFPLNEPSRASVHAPIVDGKTIALFRQDEVLRTHFRAAIGRMVRFLGLSFDGHELTKARNWNERRTDWFDHQSHNSLRITRMLKSMVLLGLTEEADALLSGLEALCDEETGCRISAESRGYWRDSVPHDA